MSEYDEDLKQNPFYKKLQDCQALAGLQSEWIICIPRKGTLSEPISETDIKNHIFVPKNASPKRYTSLSHLSILMANDQIKIEDNCDNCSAIRILFNETFYHKRLRYKVYCIEFPLARNLIQTHPVSIISNLRDCIDFLWIETYGRDVLNTISKHCQLFKAQHQCCSSEVLKKQLRHLYQKCLQVPLACVALQEKAAADSCVQRNLRIATETFMQHALDNSIFAQICAHCAQQDAILNKLTRNLQEMHVRHFQLVAYHDRIPAARCELSKINQYVTTLGKMHCIQSTARLLASKDTPTRRILNAEVLIQSFAFLIIKLNIHNWIANLVYLRDFVFAHTAQDENAYFLTTLEAAIEYIKSSDLLATINSDLDSSRNALVIHIRHHNVEELEMAFEKDLLITHDNDRNTALANLCHPLCSCEKCEQTMTETRQRPKTLGNFVDEKGRNCLHIACMYGHPQVVDLLLRKSDALLSVCDYSGMFPIHYAAQRGHLNSLLLLLHAGVDLNASNADGNSALHLAANNGHANCIKGLLYFSEPHKLLQIDATNAWGETALHLASRWGFHNIVSILMEHGIDWRIRNKRNETALCLAHSLSVRQLIRNASRERKFESQYFLTSVQPQECHKDFTCDVEEVKLYGVRPMSFEQFKKTDLLLKAIESNDLPMSCFHLGIPLSANANNNVDEDNSSGLLCHHPLCDCSVCEEVIETVVENVCAPAKLNVNICNSEGFTPLHVAAQFGRTEILRLLLDAGGNCNLQTYKACYTPLHLACINQRVAAIKELLLSGSCNIDTQDNDGNTGLHYACFKNDLRIADLLLTKGALTTLKNNKGRTVLRFAQEMSLFAVAKMIREKSRELLSTYESLIE